MVGGRGGGQNVGPCNVKTTVVHGGGPTLPLLTGSQGGRTRCGNLSISLVYIYAKNITLMMIDNISETKALYKDS